MFALYRVCAKIRASLTFGGSMRRFTPDPSFYSIEHKATRIRATEDEIERIYDAAFCGLTGDALAIKAGFLPKDFMILCQSDPQAELAAIHGKADNEAQVSAALNRNALSGDTKAAIEILKHKHGWVAAKPEGDSSGEIRIIVENSLPDPAMKK